MAILKLYRTNRITQPDLVISSGRNEKFSLAGTDVASIQGTSQNWPYARLELFSDEATDPTFVIPTISDDDQGYLKVEGSLSFIYLKCHMVLLNGPGTDGSSVGLVMGLCRQPMNGQWTTYLRATDRDSDTSNGCIGDTGWTWLNEPPNPPPGYDGPNSKFNFPLAQINQNWFQSKSPRENVHDNAAVGALLQNAFPSGKCPPNSSLQIQYVPATGLANAKVQATLAFVFRPGRDWGTGFPLPVDNGNRFALPATSGVVPFATSLYRLVQRPSDAWLTGHVTDWLTGQLLDDSSHQEWLVTLDSGDFATTWNKAVIGYNESLRTVRSVNRVTLLPLVISPTGPASSLDVGGESFNLSAAFYVRFRENPGDRVDGDPMNTPVTIQDLTVQPFRVRPSGTLTATLQFFLNVRDSVPDTADRDMQNLSVFYNATLDAINLTDGLDHSFGFTAVLGTQTTPAGVVKLNQQVRIGSLDLTFGGDTTTIPEDRTQLFQLIDLSPSWAAMPRFFSKMRLPLLSVTPGGQDGLPASEYAPENTSVSLLPSEQCIGTPLQRQHAGGDTCTGRERCQEHRSSICP